MRVWSLLRNEVRAGPLARASASVLPCVALFLFTRDADFLRIALVAVAIARVAESVAPSAALLALQALTTGAAFLLFLAAIGQAWTLAVAVAVVAAGCFSLLRFGESMRSLGTWIFIPALYLACELWTVSGKDWARAVRLLGFWPVAFIIPLCVFGAWRWRTGTHVPPVRALFALAPESEAQRRTRHEAVLAITLAVACSAVYVRLLSPEHPEWAIWSSASVVTGGIGSAARKLRDRVLGAAIGVPIGFLIAPHLPDSEATHGLIAVCIALSLAGFAHYPLAFGIRSALAVMFAGAGADFVTGAARLQDVVVGGAIGVAMVLLVATALRPPARPAARPGPG